MKKNNKVLLMILIILVSVAIIACLFYILLNNNGKINQGVFRTNDALITSLVTVEEKQENKEQSMISDLLLDLSQKNTLSLLVTKDSKINDIYLDNIKINFPEKFGKMYITQPNRDDKIELNNGNNDSKVNIYTEDKGDQYLIEIEINNADFAKDVKVPENTKVVRFDGTLISLTGMKIEDIMFKIKFDLNIVDESNKVNVCNINLKLPGYELANTGIGVTNCDLHEYNFVVKDKFSFNLF